MFSKLLVCTDCVVFKCFIRDEIVSLVSHWLVRTGLWPELMISSTNFSPEHNILFASRTLYEYVLQIIKAIFQASVIFLFVPDKDFHS